MSKTSAATYFEMMTKEDYFTNYPGRLFMRELILALKIVAPAVPKW